MTSPEAKRQDVIYPPKCEGLCHLGTRALALIDGVLAANCPGPGLLREETVVLGVGPDGEATLASTSADDLHQFGCQNPRLVRRVQHIVDNTVEDLIVQTVKMEE